MNLVAHERTESLVDELMTRERSFPVKFVRNDDSLEVRIVVTENLDYRAAEAGLDQPCNLCWIHNVKSDV